jgi:hypothetical protein
VTDREGENEPSRCGVILNVTKIKAEVKASVEKFEAECSPLETGDGLVVLVDRRTNANYCECHIKGSALKELATTDVPLDPGAQAQYKANREVLTDDPAFRKMQDDAKLGRSFSNIVAEYTKDFDPGHPLKIVGGQHRSRAINDALREGVDEYHGVKVYFLLDKSQRLDVQLISNTNIAISRDLFDRLQETFVGPQLRDWCHKVGLLPPGEDFADKYKRGGRISVRMAKTFVTNYVAGSLVNPKEFAVTNTAPVICPTGEHDPAWEDLKANNPRLWSDAGLMEAATEFSKLVSAQRAYFKKGSKGAKPKGAKPDYPEKAWSPAIYSAWAYVAGLLKDNKPRLKHHYGIRNATGRDPLNAAALTLGRHKSDPSNYRGLGYRTDPRERGRFVELFFFQAEKGTGITPANIKVAIAEYHAKQGILNAARERDRASGAAPD